MSNVQYNPDSPDVGIFAVLSPVTREGIERIPVGSENLIVDWDSGVLEAGKMSEAEKEAFLIRAADLPPEGVEGVVFVHVAPVTREQASEVASRIMVEHGRDKLAGFEYLTLRELREMLIEATIAGRMVPADVQ